MTDLQVENGTLEVFKHVSLTCGGVHVRISVGFCQ